MSLSVLRGRAPVRKVRLTAKGCPVFIYTKSRINQLMKDAVFARWEITRVGKLYCVVAHVTNQSLV